MIRRPDPCAGGPVPAGAVGLPLMRRGEECEHFCALAAIADPRAERCEECEISRSLRVCLTCGHVGCCDSGRGHAREHASETGHLLIRAWRGGAFVYCYEHRYL